MEVNICKGQSLYIPTPLFFRLEDLAAQGRPFPSYQPRCFGIARLRAEAWAQRGRSRLQEKLIRRFLLFTAGIVYLPGMDTNSLFGRVVAAERSG